MRYFWIMLLTMFVAGCGNDFVPTPVPEEINTVVYTNGTSNGNVIMRMTNNDLKVQVTTQDQNGRVVSNKTGKASPNSYNIMATRLEKANFMKVKSVPYSGNSTSDEKLVITTQEKTYTFTQDSNTRFPPDIAETVALFPRIFPVR